MMYKKLTSFISFLLLLFSFFLVSCKSEKNTDLKKIVFPEKLVSFDTADAQLIFEGATDSTAWDHIIRERGFIIREDSLYHMWYTGHQKDWKKLKLGYATSIDGLTWTRYPGNPIYDSLWTEDMMVVKDGDVYHMFAEGKGDIAHRLSSRDKIHWTEHGALDIRYTNDQRLSDGPFGTPTAIKEKDTWYLFYERNDSAVWLATSKDLIKWVNVQDDAVLYKGPENYDKYGIALNQIINYEGKYYGYYHGTPDKDWSTWNINVAVSDDKIHWKKYEGNPIMQQNKSSGIVIADGEFFRLYSMHSKVEVHFPMKK